MIYPRALSLLFGTILVAEATAFTPALAQAVDSNQPFNDGSAVASMTVSPGAVAPGLDPGTRMANLGMGQSAVVAMSAADAAYQADLDRYRDAVRARHISISSTHADYQHRERAFAAAMTAWRAQVSACHSGSIAACRAPTPNPADFN